PPRATALFTYERALVGAGLSSVTADYVRSSTEERGKRGGGKGRKRGQGHFSWPATLRLVESVAEGKIRMALSKARKVHKSSEDPLAAAEQAFHQKHAH